MNNPTPAPADRPADQANQHQSEVRQPEQNSADSSQTPPEADRPKTVDVRDLVYKGGFSRDPGEILGNPAVAPSMLDDGRDRRADLFPEPRTPDPTDSDD